MFPVEDKNDVLELNSSPKANGIFATDQTPTPTGLFKNCEEFGIFEDLNVNPFEEIFRHAVEEKTNKVSSTEKLQADEDSLHTPQVFAQLEPTTNATQTAAITRTQSANSDLTTPNEVDLKSTKATKRENKTVELRPAKKYRAIAEKRTSSSTIISGTAIPIQTVKPLFKVNTHLKPAASQIPTCTVTSPSSASLTPTSQLPIKERLKVILNNNKSQREKEENCRVSNSLCKARVSATGGKYDERSLERRRAAATRYRTKMREEHKSLKKRNDELQAENDKLRARVVELEKKLAEKPAMSANAVPLQIPPSSIHFVMNIPKLFLPTNGPPLLHNPITYSVEKK